MAPKNPTLYHVELSPPSRVVVLTAKALDLPIDIKLVDYLNGENMTPEFLKMNPQHTVPTIDDNGFHIWDSHAIATYLITKYGPKDFPWYPSCPKKRAQIDQKLHFESGSLFFRMRDLLEPVLYKGVKTINVAAYGKIFESYDFLEIFLAHSDYLVGDSVTLADVSCATTVSAMECVVPLPKESYPRTTAWLQRMKSRSDFKEINQPGVTQFRKLLISKLN